MLGSGTPSAGLVGILDWGIGGMNNESTYCPICDRWFDLDDGDGMKCERCGDSLDSVERESDQGICFCCAAIREAG